MAVACVILYIFIYVYEHTVYTCIRSVCDSIFSGYDTLLGLPGMDVFLSDHNSSLPSRDGFASFPAACTSLEI